MPVLADHVDERSEAYQANRAQLLELLAEHDRQLALVNDGGGEKYVERHRQRGKLLCRERVELLVDRDSPFLELSPLAAWGTDFPVGAGAVHRHRRRRGRRVRDHRQRPDGARRHEHDVRPCKKNAAGDGDRPREPAAARSTSSSRAAPTCRTQSEIFIPGGQTFRDLTQLSARASRRSPSCSATPPPAAPTCPGMCDYVVMIEQRSKVFLGGPPLVKMATGEESDDESLGGAEMHAARQRPRRLLRRRRARRPAPRPPDRPPPQPPQARARRHAAPAGRRATTPSSCSASRRPTCACRSTHATCSPASSTTATSTSSSRCYGTSLVTGWAELHGYPDRHPRQPPRRAVQRGVARRRRSSSSSPTRSTRRCCSCRTPPATWSGKEYEQRGIIKDGSKMINAVANSAVPAPHGQHGAPATAPATTACAAGPTGRASCSRGPTPRPP